MHRAVLRRIRASIPAWLLCAAVLVAGLATPAAAGEPVRVKGCSVRLVPPEGFVPAERFPGFQDAEDATSSIQVNVVPGPAAEVRKAMTKEALATRGVRLVATTTEKVNGGEALLIRAEQSAQGLEFRKWMLVAGDEKSTVMIVATFAADAPAEREQSMKAAVLSAVWDSDAVSDRFDGLPFRLSPGEKLKFAGRLGNALLLNESGKTGDSEEAILAVAEHHSAIEIRDLAAFSRTTAKQSPQTTGHDNFRSADVKVAGLDAHELLADAKDRRTQKPVLFYQVVVRDGDGCWLVLGLVAADRAEEMLPEFRKVVASMTRQDEGTTPPPPAKPEPESPPAPKPPADPANDGR